jgi:hypothetical protein
MKFVVLRRGVAGLLLAAAAAAHAQTAAQETLRPEVATPARAAIEALKASRFAEALSQVAEAEKVPNRTPYENFVLDQVRGGAAAGAGDTATAVKSYEAVLATNRLPPAEALAIVEGLVGTANRAKDWERVVTWGRRYLDTGGTNAQVRRMLVNALYQRNDFAGAAKEVGTLIDADEKAGQKPGEDVLRLLASSQLKQNDEAGYSATLERLLRWHPKPPYWRDRLSRLQREAGFDDALTIDSYRLLAAAGAMEEAQDYGIAADLALRATLPTEAKKFLDAATAAGKLAPEAEALKQRATKDSAADEKELLATTAPPASGNALVATGIAHAVAGRADRGIALVEQGLAKGNVTKPDAARLRLGWLLASAGRTEPARAVFKDLQGKPGGVGGLARLWLIHLDKPAS